MRRVLIVDDEAPVRRCLQRALRAEFAVEAVESGREAIARMAMFQPDAVVSDAAMPGMTGLELLAAVERLRPGCVRYLISGFDVPDPPAGVEMLSKPWSPADLLARLRRSLAQGPSEPPEGRAPPTASSWIVRDVMRPAPVVLRSTYTVAQAEIVLLGAWLRHLPIIDSHGGLVGMVSERHLLAAHSRLLRDSPVSHVMTRNVRSADASTPVLTALEMMLLYEVDALPVLSEGRLVGIVSSTDILRLSKRILEGGGVPATSAADEDRLPRAAA